MPIPTSPSDPRRRDGANHMTLDKDSGNTRHEGASHSSGDSGNMNPPPERPRVKRLDLVTPPVDWRSMKGRY
jgi:hypothetical protein